MSRILLWFRRFLARLFPERITNVSRRQMFRHVRHSHDASVRRSHEIGNVLCVQGKRRGRPIPTW